MKETGTYGSLDYGISGNGCAERTLLKDAIIIKQALSSIQNPFHKLTRDDAIELRNKLKLNKISAHKIKIKNGITETYYKPMAYRTKKNLLKSLSQFWKFYQEYMYLKHKKEISNIFDSIIYIYMKKEKSKVILRLILICIGLLLVFNIWMQSEENSCYQKIDELSINRSATFYNFYMDFSTLTALNLFSMLSNESNLISINDTLIIKSNSKIENFTDLRGSGSINNQKKLQEIEKQLNLKKVDCKKYSIYNNFILYAVSFLYLLAIIFGLKIYMLYKT